MVRNKTKAPALKRKPSPKKQMPDTERYNYHTPPENDNFVDTNCEECGVLIPYSSFGNPKKCAACEPPKAEPMRLCHRCEEFKIPETEPEWKTVCPACYLEGRDCVTCGQKISPSAPKFAKVCLQCFKDKRAKTHTTCPSCKGEKAKHLRRKKTEPFCKDCMQNLSIFKKPQPK